MLGERAMFVFTKVINLSVDEVKLSDALDDLSEAEINSLNDFTIFLYFIKEKELKRIFLSFMTLLFPNYLIKIQEDFIKYSLASMTFTQYGCVFSCAINITECSKPVILSKMSL